MEYFGSSLRTPRVSRRESYVHRSSSAFSTRRPSIRRSSVFSTIPRSRSSFGYAVSSISHVGREGGVVTKHLSSAPLYTPSFDGFYSYSTLPLRSSLYSKSGRSFSVEPLALGGWERTLSPIRSSRSFFAAHSSQSSSVSSTPRLARIDTLNHPYAVNSSGSGSSEVVVKRSSGFHHSPLRTLPLTTFSEKKVVEESKIEASKAYLQEKGISDAAESEKRITVHRVDTPYYAINSSGSGNYEVVMKSSSSSSSYKSPVRSVPVKTFSVVSEPVTKLVEESNVVQKILNDTSATDKTVYNVEVPHLTIKDTLNQPYYGVRSSGCGSYEMVTKSSSSYRSPVRNVTVKTFPVVESINKLSEESKVITNKIINDASTTEKTTIHGVEVPHLTIKETFNQPYYGVHSSGSGNYEVVMKSSSSSSSYKSPVRSVPVKTFLVVSEPVTKLVEESNVVQKILNDTSATDKTVYNVEVPHLTIKDSVNQPYYGVQSSGSGSYEVVMKSSSSSSHKSPVRGIETVSVVSEPVTKLIEESSSLRNKILSDVSTTEKTLHDLEVPHLTIKETVNQPYYGVHSSGSGSCEVMRSSSSSYRSPVRSLPVKTFSVVSHSEPVTKVVEESNVLASKLVNDTSRRENTTVYDIEVPHKTIKEILDKPCDLIHSSGSGSYEIVTKSSSVYRSPVRSVPVKTFSVVSHVEPVSKFVEESNVLTSKIVNDSSSTEKTFHHVEVPHLTVKDIINQPYYGVSSSGSGSCEYVMKSSSSSSYRSPVRSLPVKTFSVASHVEGGDLLSNISETGTKSSVLKVETPHLVVKDIVNQPFYDIRSSGSGSSEVVIKTSSSRSPVRSLPVKTFSVVSHSEPAKTLAEECELVSKTSSVKEVVSDVTEKLNHFETPRLSRRDYFIKPYYTVNSSGFGSGEVFMKRSSSSSSYNHQSPFRTLPVKYFTVSTHAEPIEKVVTENSIISEKASFQEKTSSSAETGKKIETSVIEVPSLFDHHDGFFRRSSLLPHRERSSFYSYRGSSVGMPLVRRSSLSLTPVRRMSVMTKSTTSNGPKRLVEVVDVQPLKTTVTETKVEGGQFAEHSESFEELRRRTMEAKNQLGRHRILVDRYLPVKMGPEPDVAFVIQNKYEDLVERMPFIERRSNVHVEESKESKEESYTVIKPYTPAQTVRSHSSSMYKVNVPNSFTPIVSDTRKKAREVLCKVKGDPFYFNFNH